jgi:histidine ammonia-lyase
MVNTNNHNRAIGQLFDAVDQRLLPNTWKNADKCIAKQHKELLRLIAEGQTIYGATTLPGHKDHVTLSPSMQARNSFELIQNHCIGNAPYFDDETARYIGYAKLQALSLGGTGISPQTYRHLLRTVNSPDFRPKIPMHASYSAGDVIPGAHWARSALQFDDYVDKTVIGPKDGMSLINGNFVHVGVILSVLPRLSIALKLGLEACRSSLMLSRSKLFFNTDHPELADFFGKYSSAENTDSTQTQKSISIRAIPQVTIALKNNQVALQNCVDQHLQLQSDNPLIDDEGNIHSQASFFCPEITIATSAMIESVLFSMWACVGRASYILSGHLDEIPEDGATNAAPLGLIQYPKLMTAILEKARSRYGRRTFSSGGATSHGIEDLWSHGTETAIELKNLIEAQIELHSTELAINFKMGHQFFPKSEYFASIYEHYGINNPNEILKNIDILKPS